MKPVVNGLEAEFKGKVLFLYVDAADDKIGLPAFQSLRLPGHPSYVIFRSDGTEIYRGLSILPAETLRSAILDGLKPR